jgi:hypothetical protein
MYRINFPVSDIKSCVRRQKKLPIDEDRNQGKHNPGEDTFEDKPMAEEAIHSIVSSPSVLLI